ncbi:O-fucosyltransferase 6-like isoform X2 [Cornus florida]|uniref:O-fucosyltransferase 6-like isoform X2 n=1 Tax=Cornus florida TaxID=4283 RepID=UPI00289B3209|nr:O-fucosyltransferase 6-like isoform X2 [Cornus florida]
MKKKKRDNAVAGVQIIHGALFRRRRHLHHFLPLLSAVAGALLFLIAVISFLSPPITNHNHPHSSLEKNGSVVRSNVERRMVFLVPTNGGSLGRDLWSSRQSNIYYGCSNASHNFPNHLNAHPKGYLMIATSGGLNQQRTGITDAVVAAHILNATLVIPKLDQKSFWKDASDFAEIFDVDWFISHLKKDVEIIKQLPAKGGKVANPYTMRVPRKCTPRCYQNRVLPVLKKKHVVQLTKFDYRLANRLDTELQKLRCRVNYHALKFTDSILAMGEKLVTRMRMKSKHFIALHLRFEPDMLAFSGCYYGGGEKEMGELGAIRKRWKTLHIRNPDKERRHGKCPLTPEEVGLMLRSLGFGNDVHIYVASGEVYGGEETLAPLKALFPNFHSKETIASKEELAPFTSFSSRMAALDFIVCDESDVFVTNNNGNMARMLAGRRRYFGHKPTIRPNAKKLYRLFMSRENMTWEEFASRVRTNQIGFMGEPNEMRPGRGEFHENPSSCICENFEAKARRDSETEAIISHKNATENNTKKEPDETINDQFTEDEQDWSEQPELEEMFSD